MRVTTHTPPTAVAGFRGPRRSPRRAASLAAAGVASGAVFTALAVASARRATEPADRAIHAEMRRRMEEADVTDVAEEAAPKIDSAGKWWIYTPAALIAAGVTLMVPSDRVRRRSRRPRIAGAAAIALVPAVVSALSPLLDAWIPQPPVGPRRRPLDHPVFPSGHAFRTTAVAMTSGYVLTRNRLVHGAVTWPAAIAMSAAIGIARLVREKHLASDVLGGWAAGITIAAVTSAALEVARSD